MKIDRLIGILSILLQQEKVTAPYLAEKFEVSRRTINRDIEDLCKAGIPVTTAQGKNGGISIMEGFAIDRTLLTSSDMQSILTGLRSLDSVSGTNRYQQLMDKLSANSSTLASAEHIMIDLSSYYKPSLAPKIQLIQNAIEHHNIIRFTYFSPKGESVRKIEPYLLTFQWSSWYVWGYCFARNDYRLFKLNRLMELAETDEVFVPRQTPAYTIEPENAFPPLMEVEARFEPSAKWRLVEEFGINSFTEQEDGKLFFQFDFTDKENLFSWILSFGAEGELLEPEGLRKELEQEILTMKMKYEIKDSAK